MSYTDKLRLIKKQRTKLYNAAEASPEGIAADILNLDDPIAKIKEQDK